MAEDKLSFYSDHECTVTPKMFDCIQFQRSHPNIKYPCVILIRKNNWNDYNYYTHFNTFYLSNKDSVQPLDTVMIIQSKAKEKHTTLPAEFESLAAKEFFSRGTLSFYNNLSEHEEIKKKILLALNDIYYNHYTKEKIVAIDADLDTPYDNSLFRFDDLDVSSDYAKNAIDMLDRIKTCLESISKLEENNQKMIRKLLYGSVITALESYLGDAFKYTVIHNKKYFNSFLEKYKFDKSSDKYKYDFKELNQHGEKRISEFIGYQIKEILDNKIFHKVDFVAEIYKDILEIDLLPQIMDFRESILKRHDIFHRGGKNMAGVDLDVERVDITILISQVEKFISKTEYAMKALCA